MVYNSIYAGICIGFRVDIEINKLDFLDFITEFSNLFDILFYLNTTNFDLGYKVV
jgi:hypothetical protein